MSHDSDGLGAPLILVPESLNLANFTTDRYMTLVVPGITTEISPRVTEPWSFHHHDLDGVQSTQIPVPESPNCTVFTTYRYYVTKMPRGFWSQNY